MKYNVVLILHSGLAHCLEVRGKIRWCKRVAKRHQDWCIKQIDTPGTVFNQRYVSCIIEEDPS
jgi:hypothetical protein